MNLNETVVVPIIISIVELAKGLGLPKKFSALLALLAGALLGIFFVDPLCFRTGLIKGIVYGLTASGLYSGAKNTIEQVRNNKDKETK